MSTLIGSDGERIEVESEAAVAGILVPVPGMPGAPGSPGVPGPANTLSIGSVTSGTTPSATITGSAPAQTLNLVLAKGDPGEKGDPGDAGTPATASVAGVIQLAGDLTGTAAAPVIGAGKITAAKLATSVQASLTKADGSAAQADKGVANGYAPLDENAKVPALNLPSYVDDVLEYAALANFPATGEAGKIYVATGTGKCYRWSGSAYVEISPSEVNSVAGKTGVVTLVKGDVGLGNVDNTSDANKPISTATQTALNGKSPTITDRGAWATSIAYVVGDIVTSQYARWYCKTAHTSGTWAETNWVHLGLYAIGATADPGVSGRLWVDVS